jgi:hypothetical protein
MSIEQQREQLIEETIENLFAILVEADTEFRQELYQALNTTLTSWIPTTENSLERRNLLGLVKCISTESDKDSCDKRLIEEGFTCVDLLSKTKE